MKNVNSVGFVLEIFYSVVLCYYIDLKGERIRVTKILIGSTSFTLSVLLLITFMDDELTVNSLGSVCVMINVVCFASPLSTVKEVIA